MLILICMMHLAGDCCLCGCCMRQMHMRDRIVYGRSGQAHQHGMSWPLCKHMLTNKNGTTWLRNIPHKMHVASMLLIQPV